MRMNTKAGVALSTTIHDPEGRMLALTRAFAPRLKEIYRAIVAEVTDATAPELISALEQMGSALSVMPKRPLGAVRRAALELAMRTECSHYHFCDYDRILHWMKHYPEEIRAVVHVIPQYDFLILGRSERALESHPEIQVATERVSNAVFSAEYGATTDITAAARGISREAAGLILRFSTAPDVGVDAEWPLIVQRHSDLRRGYLEVEGLEFETSTFFETEIEEAGGAKEWKDMRSELPEERRYRHACLEGITAATRRFAEGQGTGRGSVGKD